MKKRDRTVVSENAVVLKDIQHPAHLAEEENARTLSLDPLEEVVQNEHLASVFDEVHVGGEGRPGLNAVKEVRVVAALAKLHDNVKEAGFSLPLSNSAIDCVNILHEELLVKIALQLGHGDVELDLFLGLEGLLHLRLEPSQQEGFEDLVELLNNILLL